MIPFSLSIPASSTAENKNKKSLYSDITSIATWLKLHVHPLDQRLFVFRRQYPVLYDKGALGLDTWPAPVTVVVQSRFCPLFKGTASLQINDILGTIHGPGTSLSGLMDRDESMRPEMPTQVTNPSVYPDYSGIQRRVCLHPHFLPHTSERRCISSFYCSIDESAVH
jgi:hypothetical protein